MNPNPLVHSPQGDSSIASLLNQHTIVLGNALGKVSEQRVLAATEASLVPRGVGECQVREGAVNRDADNLTKSQT